MKACRNVGIQECRNVEMQECWNKGMQECRNIEMVEWLNNDETSTWTFQKVILIKHFYETL